MRLFRISLSTNDRIILEKIFAKNPDNEIDAPSIPLIALIVIK